MIRGLLFLAAISSVIAVFFIIFFLVRDAYQIFFTVSPAEILLGDRWDPTGYPPEFGTLPLWAGTLLVTLGAILFAVPLSLGTAIFIAEVAPLSLRLKLKPLVELLAAIPSVVYGFFGLAVLTPWLADVFQLLSGQCWLAGSLLLGVMALPTIVSVSEDTISAVPRELREGSLAIGATRWQTITRVVTPAALSGITAAVILGIGRAIGETMAVLMVTGNAAVIPSPLWDVFSPIRTLTGTLGIEMGEVAMGSTHYHALFGVAIILLVITLAINLVARVILDRVRRSQTGGGTRSREILSREVRSRIGKVALVTVVVLALAVAFLIGGITAAAVLALAGGLAWAARGRLSPRTTQGLALVLVGLCAAVVLFILGVILFDIIVNGLPAISWEFLTTGPRNLGRDGGIYPAIVGTLFLVAGAIAFALPLGVGAAIYLVEYTRGGRAVNLIRTGIDLLNGTPSIVFGLFGFAFLVLYLGWGVSLLAGQVTLGLMVLPTIIRTTEEALKSVPQSLREGSLALGASWWQTIRQVVLPAAMGGVVTGTILSLGRAAGETAPILFTAVVFSRRFLPSSPFEPVMALPYHLYILATNVPRSEAQQYGTALVLLVLVGGLYLVAILIRNHYRKTVRW
ncbi:MAG: phosphate ABC transporter permease PstA [Methanomicrobiales archaeon]|nr:phosphate ABC transporter permease PstA [Methanomicrobiales archaeon]